MRRQLKLSHFVELDTVGGVERSFSQFIGYRLSDVDLTHQVILTKSRIAAELKPAIERNAISSFDLKHVGKFRLPGKPLGLRSFLLQRRLRTMSPDAVIVWSIPKYLEYATRLTLDVPVIYYERGASWMKPIEDKDYMNALLEKTDGIICNSHAAKRMLQIKWRLNKHIPIHVVLNAVRPDCLPVTMPARNGLHENPIRLGVAGRLINIKGVGLAIQALATVRHKRPAELYIAGIGPEQQNLLTLAKALDVASHVHFLGLVSDMREFFKHIDILICPSLREPFGLVCAEAMGCGCPVIASEVDGLPEVVADGKTGFCLVPSIPLDHFPRWGGHTKNLPSLVYDPVNDTLTAPKLIDPEAIAEKIELLVNDKDLYARMSRQCIASAQTQFSFSRHMREVASSIVDMIEASGGMPNRLAQIAHRSDVEDK